ncbi:hypothetical protein [Nitrogeniibacter aestuarii]|uniref:hypothetical protein n=1 Tax=Nitrogeniibacter aestuarii TaxID=2815343 RepID=UPI001E4117B4|nr:hypothetical protein [Nitrogeniibacter aestuarii]
MNKKEYGKLSLDQFRSTVRLLPEVRSEFSAFEEVARTKAKKFMALLDEPGLAWASIYERPFHEQMALMFVFLGWNDDLHETASQEDPQEALLDWVNDGGRLDQWYEEHKDDLDFRHLVWLCVMVQRNVLAIMLFGQSMGTLVARVREGDEDALFDAVRVDRSVLLAPTCSDRLSRAELINDKHFFLRLRGAMKGPSKKYMSAIQDLRYSIALLRDCGFDRFSDQDLETLFISTRLYPNSPGALKNLRKHIHASKKLSTL